MKWIICKQVKYFTISIKLSKVRKFYFYLLFDRPGVNMSEDEDD